MVSKQPVEINYKDAQLGGPTDPWGNPIGTAVGNTINYTNPIKMTASSPGLVRSQEELAQRYDTLGADPLAVFARRGQAEAQDPRFLESRYGSGFDQNFAGFGGPKSLGMSDPLTSALNKKLQSSYASTIGDVRGQLMRQTPLDQAKRFGVYQSIQDSKTRLALQQRAEAERKAAEKKSKKAGFLGSLGSVGGAIAGGIIGGPAGAAIGSGLGGMAGQQLGGG